MKNKPNRAETEAKINAHAWKDPAFKKKLLSNPKTALQEMGMTQIPNDLKVDVVKEEKNHWCIVLHEPPKNRHDLSEDELKTASGGHQCVIE